MALVKAGNAVLVQTTTVGTGTYSLGSALTGFNSFANGGISTGDRVTYVVVDSLTAPTLREYGEGVYTSGSPGVMTRALVLSNAGSAINWSAGTKYLFLAPHAASLPLLDTDGKLQASQMPMAFADGSDVWNLPGRNFRREPIVYTGPSAMTTPTATVYATDVVPYCSAIMVSVSARIDYTGTSPGATATLRIASSVSGYGAEDVDEAFLNINRLEGKLVGRRTFFFDARETNVTIQALALIDFSDSLRMIRLRMEVASW